MQKYNDYKIKNHTDNHKNKKHNNSNKENIFKTKTALKKKIRKAVVWWKNSEDISLIKNIIINNMKNMLILQFWNFQFSENDKYE